MDVQNYFISLSRECNALKDRVRHLINDQHWLTDGEWKESVIRQVLRRNLPATVKLSRGFVVSGARESHQLDVLVHDASKPVVFQDGDLAFVTPDAVLGVIEVKSRITAYTFEESARKLARDMSMVRRHPNSKAFAAIFAFDGDGPPGQTLVDILARVAPTWNERIDFAAVGDSTFLKYWDFHPSDILEMYECWHSYSMPGLAAGYFVHNVVDSISPRSVFSNEEVWFPAEGKEPYRDGCVRSAWARPRQD